MTRQLITDRLAVLRRSIDKQCGNIRILDRLHDMLVEAGLCRTLTVGVLSPTRDGHEHDFFSPIFIAYLSGNFVSVEMRQTDIEKDKIRPNLSCSIQGL